MNENKDKFRMDRVEGTAKTVDELAKLIMECVSGR